MGSPAEESVSRGGGLAFTVVVGERPQRRFEVGRRLLLDLVRERVDLEAVQPGTIPHHIFF